MATIASSLPLDENIGPLFIILSGVLVGLAILTTLLRLFVRGRKRILGWDDGFMAIVTAIAIVRIVLQALQVSHGNGRHKWFISRDDYVLSLKHGFYAQILLFAGMCFLKVSISLLILRIKQDRWLKILLYVVIAGLALSSGAVIIILLAECHPMEAYWQGNGTCWDARVRTYAIWVTIAFGILTDFLLSLLPLIVVWKIRIRFKLKFMVCGLMSLGLIATGFGIVRATALSSATDDLSWTYCTVAIWANCEYFLGIITANLAVSRAVYMHFFEPDSDKSTAPNSSSVKSACVPNAKLRNDLVHEQETVIRSRMSQASDRSLQPGIRKRTEFWLEFAAEDDLEAGMSESSSAPESPANAPPFKASDDCGGV